MSNKNKSIEKKVFFWINTSVTINVIFMIIYLILFSTLSQTALTDNVLGFEGFCVFAALILIGTKRRMLLPNIITLIFSIFVVLLFISLNYFNCYPIYIPIICLILSIIMLFFNVRSFIGLLTYRKINKKFAKKVEE